MFHKKPGFLVALMAASLSLCACREFSIYDDYIDMPDHFQVTKLPAHRVFRKGLLALNISEGASPEEILQRAKESQGFGPDETEVHADLASVATANKCSRYLAEMLISILAHIRDDPQTPLKVFDKFVRSDIVAAKLRRCARSSEMDYLQDGDQTVNLFDQLFIDGLSFGWRNKIDLSDLTCRLSKLSLLTDKFNSHKMNSFAKKHHLSYRSKFASLENFITHKCLQIRTFDHILNTINLARALANYDIHSAYVKRLNEYYRMCLKWQSGEHRKIMENLARH